MSGLRFPHEELTGFAAALLRASKVPEQTADRMARSLVAASLRGTDSHGVQLLTFYLRQLEDGRVNPVSRGSVISESGAVLHYDGGNSLGQVVAEECCDHAVRLAREHGAGVAVARESNHFGAAAWWGQRISSSGMLGIVMCNASPSVPPWQGKDPRWGTNPICVSMPGNLWLLDMATTTVAQGRIYKARFSGQESIPHGWAMDKDGVPTTSTAAALTGLLMPLGGYKGSGLAMMVEILTGVLSGGAISTELGGLRFTDRPFRVSQFFLALDISRIMPVAQFEERLGRLVAMAKSASAAPGYEEVLVAGEPEWRAERDYLESGVPLTEGVWAEMCAFAQKLGVQAPAPRN